LEFRCGIPAFGVVTLKWPVRRDDRDRDGFKKILGRVGRCISILGCWIWSEWGRVDENAIVEALPIVAFVDCDEIIDKCADVGPGSYMKSKGTPNSPTESDWIGKVSRKRPLLVFVIEIFDVFHKLGLCGVSKKNSSNRIGGGIKNREHIGGNFVHFHRPEK
jgi:hypothetical protein